MKVPQIIPETGISADYWNEYFAKTSYFREGISKVALGFRKYPVRKYQQLFPPEEYEEVITPENKIRIYRLDELANHVNRRFIDENTFTEREFKQTITEVHQLIYGNSLNRRPLFSYRLDQ